ncbi:GlxA family transcriptional regulator [Dactylosporangium sp. NPDC000521]|uniref:GlxA family transcriptional regulator n=1 Tax=Dactylosporangium sp. NPDC000521 TaxID=3363975 RepID=UPI0036B6FA2E
MPFHRVAAYIPSGAAALGLGMASAAFRSRSAGPGFDFAVCADRRGPVATDAGVPVMVDDDIELLTRADLVLVLPGAQDTQEPADALLDALCRAHARGAIVAAHCLGVFTVAAAGLLNDRAATTHWQHADDLATRYPMITVQAELLYVDQDRIVTGAGAAAGMDMYLHLIRREHGAAHANALARLLVMPPHREGGQQQYVDAPVADGRDAERLTDVLAWARAHLGRRLTVDTLATRALMSRRSFIRHFAAATGTTPHAWLRAQRLSLAEELLENTSLTTEQIAQQAGYSSAAALRQQFLQRRGIPPRDYRRAFRQA